MSVVMYVRYIDGPSKGNSSMIYVNKEVSAWRPETWQIDFQDEKHNNFRLVYKILWKYVNWKDHLVPAKLIQSKSLPPSYFILSPIMKEIMGIGQKIPPVHLS